VTRRRASLAAGFGLGLVAAAPALVVALAPAAVYRAWCRLRHGGVPSATGVVLSVAPVPAALAAQDGRPCVLVWFTNVGRAPAPLCWSDPPGDELAVEVTGPGGVAAPRRSSEEATVARVATTLRRTWLAPGERLGLRCDLSRWVTLPGPGEYEVRAARAPWGDPRGRFDGLRCESAPVRVVLP
jgi:hypothetical protein